MQVLMNVENNVKADLLLVFVIYDFVFILQSYTLHYCMYPDHEYWRYCSGVWF